MNRKLAEALYHTALELVLNKGLSLSIVNCVHEFLIYIGWEFSLTTTGSIQQKADEMMDMYDWGLSRSQWSQMESVTCMYL